MTPPDNGDELARTLSHSLTSGCRPAGHSRLRRAGLPRATPAAFVDGATVAGARHQLRQPYRAARLRHRPLTTAGAARPRRWRLPPTSDKLCCMVVLSYDNVVKTYGNTTALRGVSFDVHAGEIFGSARSERRRQEHAHPHPDGHHPARLGPGEVFGEPRRREHLDRLGYLPEERGLYTKLPVIDVMVTSAR